MKGTIAVLTCVLSIGCVDEPQPVPPPPVATQDQCPAGFAPIGDLTDGCYLMLPASGWIAGEDACEQHASLNKRAHLVVVDREAEHLAFTELARNSGDIWIGRMQQDDDDEFRNINYIEWEPEYFGAGEPNDYGPCSGLFCSGGGPGTGDERCVEYKQLTGMWNDKACYRASRILCEWDGVQPYDWRPGS